MLPSFCTFRSDTSPNLMRFSCSENRWSNGNSNIIFSTRPIQNEIKISFISKHTHNTVRSSWAMHSCEWAILSAVLRALLQIGHVHGAWAWDRTKATATNDPYVRGNYRKCAYSVWKLAKCWSMYVCQSLFRLHFHFVYLHTFSLPVHVHDSYAWAVVTFASILLWQCRYFAPFLSIWNFIF